MQPPEAGQSTPDEFAASLQRSLYRFDCPAAHTLGEYELDLLDAVARTSVAAHAARCDDCLAELQMLRVYLATPTQFRESVGERVRRVVATPFAASPGLAYGAVRGTAPTPARVFEAGDVTISVESGQAPGTLIGLVVVRRGAPDELTGRAARLVALGGNAVSALIDDLGNFEFVGIEPDSYTLELDLAGRLIVIQSLQVD